MDNLSIGNNIRFARLNLGISQEEAAARCKVCEKTYGKLERDQANVTLKVLNKVAGGLGLSLIAIMQGAIPKETGAWEYFAVLEPCQVQDTITKHTYGIMACINTHMGRYVVMTVHDVSTDPGFVLDIVDCLNFQALSPVHLMDVIYDVLP